MPNGRGGTPRATLTVGGRGGDDRDMSIDQTRVRRVTPRDAAELERFYAALSPQSRVWRFHAATRGIGRANAERFAAVDHVVRDGFVATEDGRVVGHLTLEPLAPGVNEVAVAVADRAQRHGVGTLLLAAGFASARLRHVRRLVGWVSFDNAAMRRLLAGAHHPWRVAWDGTVARYELDVPARADRAAA